MIVPRGRPSMSERAEVALASGADAARADAGRGRSRSNGDRLSRDGPLDGVAVLQREQHVQDVERELAARPVRAPATGSPR